MKKFKGPLWQNLTKIILVTFLFSGCAGIPGGNVKLENYPEINKKNREGIDIRYELIEGSEKSVFNIMEEMNKIDNIKTNPRRNFNDKINETFISKDYQGSRSDKVDKCFAKIKSTRSEDFDGLCGPYFVVTFFTLFTIPFYCQINYQATATLISHPSEFSLKDKAINILPDQINLNQTQIKQSKTKNKGIVTKTNYLITQNKQRINEGDYFLDENGRLTKLLKTYELKDKVHEVWSLIWLLNPWSWNEPSDEYGRRIVEQNISEALVRSIINDASSFKECQKDQSSSSKNK